MNRQTSLNQNQAHIDDDGKARFVIAPKDHGLPNWLDRGAGRRGFVHYRWFRPDQSIPEPLAQLITLCGVRQRLPEGAAWDIGTATLFLASRESRPITGITIPVDAGVRQIAAMTGHSLIERGD